MLDFIYIYIYKIIIIQNYYHVFYWILIEMNGKMRHMSNKATCASSYFLCFVCCLMTAVIIIMVLYVCVCALKCPNEVPDERL